MPDVFTTFASSRFVDRQAVVEELRRCARELKERHAEVTAVYLFGSYADGTATPRSDADIVVEVPSDEPALRQRTWDAALDTFSKSPVAIDLFVIRTERLREGRGVASTVRHQGLQLA